MADNTTITPGTGLTIATDEVGAAHYQRIKISLGADGVAVDAVAGAGAVGAGVQRTTLASDDPAVASLAVLDDWDESDRCKVNVISGQAGVAGGAGAVGATTQRVTLASDDPAVAALAATGTRPAGVQITRPANTTQYTPGDAWADTGPTTGGFTLASAVRAAGKASRLVGLSITSSNGSPSTGALQGEVLIYNAAVTAVADNAALTITAAEARTELWEVPFALTAKRGVQIAHVPVGAPIMLPASGTDLRFLVRVTNGYTPVSGEVLTVTATFEPIG